MLCKCPICNNLFELNNNQINKRRKNPDIPIFCSRKCSGIYYAKKSHENKTEEQEKERREKISKTLKNKSQKEKRIVPGSIRSMVINKKCACCGKEFNLSYEQKKKLIKQNQTDFYCSRSCQNKVIYKNNKKEVPLLKCCICGKEFEGSRDQKTKYRKDSNQNFFCSRSCVAKFTNKNMDYAKRTEKVKEFYKDKEWVKKRQEKIEQTNLEKYGVKNTFQVKENIEKAKQTKINKYGDPNFNNRAKMKETMIKNGFNIYAPRPLVGKKVSNTWKNKSDKEKQIIKDKLSIANTKAYKAMTLSKKLEISVKQSEAQKLRWEETSEEEKARIFKKVFSHPNNAIKVISKVNKDIAVQLNIHEFEYQLGSYSYDLKKDNILIEIDPIYTHNCLQGTWYGSEPKSKEYHRDKTQYALDNNFSCIHIFDWDDIDKISYLLQDKQTLYARQLKIKSVSQEECNEFLNKYHLQNTCRGQNVKFGLYLKSELIEIMTFGKSRYNKNYEWELLRLCTHKDYKVVGGAEKLFKHFIEVISPKSIISYCDFSKFTGEVYDRLGFKQKGIAKPSKHWCKGSNHITDNLLRQRGYDQLFGTNYGKGTSNEELMIENSWLPIYDCGQLTFIWNNK